MASDGYTITPELIEEWEAQIADLQRKIAAARVLLPASIEENDGDSTNFMGAIRRLANESPKPLPKAILKELLKKEGFPEHQVGGTYFYVAIKKLKDKNTISVDDDGSVWRGSTGTIRRR